MIRRVRALDRLEDKESMSLVAAGKEPFKSVRGTDPICSARCADELEVIDIRNVVPAREECVVAVLTASEKRCLVHASSIAHRFSARKG